MVASLDAARTADGSETSIPAASKDVRTFVMSASLGRPLIAVSTVLALVWSHWSRLLESSVSS